MDVPVIVGVELVVEVGQDSALHHPRPQQQGALHQLLPLDVWVGVEVGDDCPAVSLGKVDNAVFSK